MYCQRCGNPFAPQAQFCPRCGAPRPTGVVALPPPSMGRPGAITVLAILHFFGAAMLLVGGMALLLADSVPAERSQNAVIGGVLLFLALLSIVTGIGLMGMKPWGRILQIILACIGLLAFPIGTLISILILIYMFRPGVKVLFSGRRLEELAPHELALLQSARVGGGVFAAIALVAVLMIPFIGILAAIAIPNLLTAMQRSKQKRTMADMRTIATSIEQYRVDNGRVPQAATIGELRKTLNLTMPNGADGWGKEMRYGTDGQSYWLVSGGKDMVFERETAEGYEGGKITQFDEDIVFRDGEFVRAP